MIKRAKKQKGGSRIKKGLAIAGGALLAGGVGYLAGKAKGRSSGSSGGIRRKKSAGWYARQIARLKLKKRYDKLRLSV